MTLNKALRKFVDMAKTDDGHWVELAKLDFSSALEKQRRLAGINYAGIAKKIGSSAAYITKVFRGDSNLTIESMVKLARATGGSLKIQIVDEAPVAHRWDKVIASSAKTIQSRATASTATVVLLFPTTPKGMPANQLQEAA